MTRVIAALDGGPATRPVLATAREVARLLGAGVQALHVRSTGEATARELAGAEGAPLEVVEGPTLEKLAEAAGPDDVAALVVGAGCTREPPKEEERTSVRLATAVGIPVFIVPAETSRPGRLRNVLVPLQGATPGAFAPRRFLDLATPAELEIVALRVYDRDDIPPFSDQPHHQTIAWAQEFLARYSTFDPEHVSLELRVGDLVETVLTLTGELAPDLVALAWNEDVVPNSSRLVQALLRRTRVPLLLDPVGTPPETDAVASGPRG